MADKEIRKDDGYSQEFTLDELENVSGGEQREKISNEKKKKGRANRERKLTEVNGACPRFSF